MVIYSSVEFRFNYAIERGVYMVIKMVVKVSIKSRKNEMKER